MDRFDHLSQEYTAITGQILSNELRQSAERHADLLSEWNRKISLTSITDPDEIRIKHVLDALSCQLAMDGAPVERVIDVGTGGGFPGIPLKLLYPEMQLTLVDSVAKKTAFLTKVVQELGLEGVTVLTERAEALGQLDAHREQYDWAIARAVAGLPVLAEYLLPLVKVGGFMLAQKGETALKELDAAQNAISTLGGKARPLIEVRLPQTPETRYLVIVEKISPTPPQYPRRVGIPSKRPL